MEPKRKVDLVLSEEAEREIARRDRDQINGFYREEGAVDEEPVEQTMNAGEE